MANELAPIDDEYKEMIPPGVRVSPGLALLLNDRWYEKAKKVAGVLANGKGTTPPHLFEQPEACFAVVTRSLTWGLDPFQVAASTYQTPGGRVGYEGKLIQAILENSGHIVGPVQHKLYGDWQKVAGKFAKKQSERGKDYFVPAWKTEDEAGLGVEISVQVKGEVDRRVERFDLNTFWPRNSTLWALRPWQQIVYAAVRAFANIAAPGILMGVPFDDDMANRVVEPPNKRPVRDDYQEGQVVWDKTAAEDVKTEEAVEETADPETGEIAAEAEAPAAEPAKEEQPQEEEHEFGHSDAFELGRATFKKGRSMFPPTELAKEYHDAFREGWTTAETEAKEEAKKKR